MTEERKKLENTADPQSNKILDLLVKDFKISMINIFKKIMGKKDILEEKMKNVIRKQKYIKTNEMNIIQMKK